MVSLLLLRKKFSGNDLFTKFVNFVKFYSLIKDIQVLQYIYSCAFVFLL